jgi:hypothetical protein
VGVGQSSSGIYFNGCTFNVGAACWVLPAGCWGFLLGAGALIGALARASTAPSTWAPPVGCWGIDWGLTRALTGGLTTISLLAGKACKP